MNNHPRCPGLDRVIDPFPKAYLCPRCGNEIEIWSDEQITKCSSCNTVIQNESSQFDEGVKNSSSPNGNEIARILKELVNLALKLGASGATAISAKDISVEDDLANLCREPHCENYGLSLSCPPHVRGPLIFREWLRVMEHAVIIKIDVPIEILHSDERRDIMRVLHEIVAEIESSAVGYGYSNSKAFAGGSCKKIFCRDDPGCRVLIEGGECRHPQHARPSMSGFGVNVSKLMRVTEWNMKRDVNVNKDDINRASTGMVCGLVLIG